MPHEPTNGPLFGFEEGFTDYIGRFHWGVAFGVPFLIHCLLVFLFCSWCFSDPKVGSPETALIVPLYFDSTNEVEVIWRKDLDKRNWQVVTNIIPEFTQYDLLIPRLSDRGFYSIRYVAYKDLMPPSPVAVITTNKVLEVSRVPPVPNS